MTAPPLVEILGIVAIATMVTCYALECQSAFNIDPQSACKIGGLQRKVDGEPGVSMMAGWNTQRFLTLPQPTFWLEAASLWRLLLVPGASL